MTTLAAYVGAPPADSAFVASCAEAAESLVDAYVWWTSVPDQVLEQAYLAVGSELYHRRNAPNGIAQFATADGGSPVRVARDPLGAVYPILAPFVGRGIA